LKHGQARGEVLGRGVAEQIACDPFESRAHLATEAPPGGRQLDQRRTPVGRVFGAARETFGFEPVDEPGDGARCDVECAAQLRHQQRTVVVEHAQQARSGRRETATAQAFGSQLLEQGRDRNELREDVGAQLIGRCRDGGLAH
jgi:hypothetical protein